MVSVEVGVETLFEKYQKEIKNLNRKFNFLNLSNREIKRILNTIDENVTSEEFIEAYRLAVLILLKMFLKVQIYFCMSKKY